MSDTPRTDEKMGEMCVATGDTTAALNYWSEMVDFARQLERELADYQQAEISESRRLGTSASEDLIEYIHALRAHAARVTVERDEAKAHNEKMNKLATPAEFTLAENRRLREQLAAAKEAQARAEAALEIAHNGERMVAGALMPSAEKQDAEHGDHNTGEVLSLLRFWKQHSFGHKAPIWMDEMKQRAESAERKLAEVEKEKK